MGADRRAERLPEKERPLPEEDRTMGRIFLNVFSFISVANFLAFCLISELIGGDAINGYAEHGRYFLRSHGRTTEVSEAVFSYSKWHAISLFITLALAILVAALTWGVDQNSN